MPIESDLTSLTQGLSSELSFGRFFLPPSPLEILNSQQLGLAVKPHSGNGFPFTLRFLEGWVQEMESMFSALFNLPLVLSAAQEKDLQL